MTNGDLKSFKGKFTFPIILPEVFLKSILSLYILSISFFTLEVLSAKKWNSYSLLIGIILTLLLNVG